MKINITMTLAEATARLEDSERNQYGEEVAVIIEVPTLPAPPQTKQARSHCPAAGHNRQHWMVDG